MPQLLPDPQQINFQSGAAKLAGTLFRPSGSPRAAVVIHGATGVPHRFYRHFAAWAAAEENLVVLTYDYRGFGASQTKPTKDNRALMSDWGVYDQADAQKTLEELFPDLPIWVVGHSLGGWFVPFQPGASRIKRVITVASGLVHLSDHPWPYRALATSFWYAHGPILCSTLGYIPNWAGTALPSSVYKQLRRWCTSRGFYEGDIGRELPMPDYGAFRGAARFVAIADDPIAPEPAVWRLMQRYPNAKMSQCVLRASDYSLPSIGHIKVFSKTSHVVWPRILEE